MRMMATTTLSTVLLRYGSLRSFLPLMYMRMPGAYRSDMRVSPVAPDAHARKKLYTTPNTPKRLFARTAMPERCCALPRNALEKPLSTR